VIATHEPLTVYVLPSEPIEIDCSTPAALDEALASLAATWRASMARRFSPTRCTALVLTAMHEHGLGPHDASKIDRRPVRDAMLFLSFLVSRADRRRVRTRLESRYGDPLRAEAVLDDLRSMFDTDIDAGHRTSVLGILAEHKRACVWAAA
jgi:hypothetical protein